MKIQHNESPEWDCVPEEFCMEVVETNVAQSCKGLFTSNESFEHATGNDSSKVGNNANGSANYAVKAYSVLPQDLAQRFGTTSESSQSLEAALSVAGQLSAAAKGGADVGLLQQSDARAQALGRQPLVIGYSGTGKNNASYVGWLFGPEYDANDPTHLALAQTVQNYGVTADISVPGWWDFFTATVETAWTGTLGQCLTLQRIENSCTQSEAAIIDDDPSRVNTVTKAVQLPLTSTKFSSLTSYIAARELGIAYTRVFISNVTPDVVPSCASQVILRITGENIWRANQVFLGGAPATTVTVLPDMQGIAATFDMNQVYGGTASSGNEVENVPVTVASEGGAVETQYIIIVGTRQASNGGVTCNSPIPLPTKKELLGPTVLAIAPGKTCSDAKSIPLAITGLNLDETYKIVADGFNDVTLEGREPQYTAVLKPSGTISPTTVPLILQKPAQQPGTASHVVLGSLEIDDCSKPATTQASLITTTVKIAANQTIELKIPVPAAYSRMVVAVQPDGTNITPIKSSRIDAAPGNATDVLAKINLSKLQAKPNDHLKLVVMIQDRPDTQWHKIDVDKELLVAGQ